MQLITPIVIFTISLGIFFGYTDPTYSKIVEQKKLEAEYVEALSKSRELQDIRESLLAEYNAFKAEDISRLERLLPDNIDNVRLIMEIDALAKDHGLSVKNLSVKEDAKPSESGKIVGPDTSEYSSVTLDFLVPASYEDFQVFLADLEKSLRLVDVIAINFRGTSSDFDEYKVSIKTYWLK